MNELIILAKFDYDGKTYLITLTNKKIVFYRYNNKIFSKELSNAEIDMCINILDSITVRKETSIYLRNKKIGENIYQIFYDTTTRLHWWICINSKEVIEEDNKVLMNLYNYSSDIYYFSSEKEEKQKRTFIKKMINGIPFRIAIYFTIGLISSKIGIYIANLHEQHNMIEYLDDEQLSNWKDYKRFKECDNDTYFNKVAKEQRKEIDRELDYDWNMIEQAIEENPYLNQEEKDFVKKLKFITEKDHSHMNILLVIEKLKTIRFTYFENEIPFANNARGAYIEYLNHIYFANSQSIKDVDERDNLHELMHMLAIGSSGYSNEYITELATKEYLLKLIEIGEIQPKAEWFDSNGRIINNIKFWIFA